MTAAATLIQGRCDPYGAESGGPRRILGGLYGPASARTPGMDLPQNVAEGEWSCPNTAVIRCRMTCEHGHRGQVMTLCSWHDEVSWTAEHVAGTFRQVKGTVRVRGHYEEIQRRQAGLCPPCAYPPPYAELAKEIQGWQREMSALFYTGRWRSPRAQQLRTMVEDAGLMIDAARKAGIVHNCPLTLVPVS